MRRALLACLCLAAAGLTACSGAASDDSDGASEGELNAASAVETTLEVKLYDEPNTVPEPACDRYTLLTMFRAGGALKARVEHKLAETSLCRIYVAPNERIFDVSEGDDCGSKVFRGEAGADRIVIHDHATRLCEDPLPARVVVELTVDGDTFQLYSVD